MGVMGVVRFGAYATHVITSLMFIRPLPPSWTMEEGAAFLCQGLTAFYGLKDQGNIKKNKSRVLIHSAAGGTGGIALSICRRLGCPVVATVGNTSKMEWLLEHHNHLVAEQVIVRADHSGTCGKLCAGTNSINKSTDDKGEASAPGHKLDIAMAAAGIDGFDIVLDSLLSP